MAIGIFIPNRVPVNKFSLFFSETEDWALGPSETERLVEDLHEKLDLLEVSSGWVRSLASVGSVRAGQIVLEVGLAEVRSISVPLKSMGLQYTPWTGKRGLSV